MEAGASVIVWDLEIEKEISECSRGWSSHDEMGISSLCMFDYQEMRFRIFDLKSLDQAIDIMRNRSILVGYNNINFDDKVLSYFMLPQVGKIPPYSFDILKEIRSSLGGSPFIKGCKLDEIAGETLGLRKSGNGALAPVLHKQGRYAELHDYCLQDVNVTKQLFEFILTNGYILKGGIEVKVNTTSFQHILSGDLKDEIPSDSTIALSFSDDCVVADTVRNA